MSNREQKSQLIGKVRDAVATLNGYIDLIAAEGVTVELVLADHKHVLAHIYEVAADQRERDHG